MKSVNTELDNIDQDENVPDITTALELLKIHNFGNRAFEVLSKLTGAIGHINVNIKIMLELLQKGHYKDATIIKTRTEPLVDKLDFEWDEYFEP